MSIPPLPPINVSSLTIDYLHLDRINVDYVTFEKLDTHGYFMSIYILLWILLTLVLIQTSIVSFVSYRYIRYTSPPALLGSYKNTRDSNF